MGKDRPQKPARIARQWPALALAIAVHVAFIAVLIFSLRWQNRKPEPVSAELYAPPSKAQSVVEPAPPPRPEPVPEQRSAPPPAAEPQPEPKTSPPPPKSAAKPEPKAAIPDPKAAEVAAREKAEREKKEAAEREAEKKRQAAERRLAETRERQQRETEALKAQAEREQVARAAQQKVDAEAAERARAEADYVRRIQSKVKGNVVLPPDLSGNPEAVFEVVQLPTGEIIDAVLRKSSGVRAYDDAVQRAIIKSSPLPKPERPDLFQRALTLKFRPAD
jgi:colicin import membrane protein